MRVGGDPRLGATAYSTLGAALARLDSRLARDLNHDAESGEEHHDGHGERDQGLGGVEGSREEGADEGGPVHSVVSPPSLARNDCVHHEPYTDSVAIRKKRGNAEHGRLDTAHTLTPILCASRTTVASTARTTCAATHGTKYDSTIDLLRIKRQRRGQRARQRAISLRRPYS